jgi:hypothetical protein
MARFRTHQFYHNALCEVAEKHGLKVERSYETIEAGKISRHATIILPNGCPIGSWETGTPEKLDKFLTLILPAIREEAKNLVSVNTCF